VNPIPYYESCVSDFCGCDSVGDCECFCTSVAAYARSCSTAGVCINWRTPAICRKYCTGNAHRKQMYHVLGHRGKKKSRILVSQHVCDLIGSCLQELENKSFPVSETWRLFLFVCLFVFPSVPAVFCDYYNPPDKHEWFYKPCGAPCLKTCRNPQGKCGNILYSLEGNSSLTLMQFVEDLSDFKCLKQQDCCLTLEEYLICPRNSLTVPCLRLILCAVVPFEAEFACYF